MRKFALLSAVILLAACATSKTGNAVNQREVITVSIYQEFEPGLLHFRREVRGVNVRS